MGQPPGVPEKRFSKVCFLNTSTISLQSESHPIEFRKVELRELAR
jgi:hypothetical protein